MLCYATLRYATLWYAMVRYGTLCYAMLRYKNVNLVKGSLSVWWKIGAA